VDYKYSPEVWNTPGVAAKNTNRQFVGAILGTVTDGSVGRRDLPIGYATGIGVLACYILQFELVPRKWLQIWCGRWVRGMILNRAVAGCLYYTWEVLAAPSRMMRICTRIATEMILACCALPLCYTDLRLKTDEVVSATDASSTGGGISRSTGLTNAGKAALSSRMNVAFQKRSKELGLWSWFDGISGFRQAWGILGLPVGCHIASEVERTAIRVTSSI
jgi:hypothetical protein